MVSIWRNHHGRRCVLATDRRCLYYRYASDNSTRYIHVEHVVCMQVSHAWLVFSDNYLLTLVSSILYKTKLPFILVFNKTDVQTHEFAIEWMQDFEAFQAALASHQGTTDDEGEPTYMNSLMNSMSLVLDEFYKHLTVSRPAHTRGAGC